MKGSNGQDLAGADFALYQGVGGQPSPNPVDPGSVGTGETGELVITNLAAGTYWLEMTKAPDGYTLLAQRFRVNIRADGTVVLAGRPVTPQASLENNGNGKYTIVITVTQAGQLPFAGGPAFPWL